MRIARTSQTAEAGGATSSGGFAGANATPRIIKKYPNRRLYDTHDSRYVTLNDVARLVFEHESFEVIDQKTGDTLTCGILLQIMAEQAHSGRSPLSRELLAQMIRVYNGQLPAALRAFLQNSLSMFLEQHQKIDALLDGRIQSDPTKALTELVEENLQQWTELNEELLRAVVTDGCRAGPDEIS